ncbi:M48 family metalloprotease [Actinosynnema mirum]|uniref:Peptidase M48 Ste24p n=1 Tax=Actinosynnema mirum (strain ATCC 29888 / DSM 43827 / JCM 3225 / NBRC 14064 / NCIMB 13271 / NRRL B-12336 / IMRU 3971 / 101) TaxID=446462 RepID=C6WP83_ACTMD|nr:M48 family metalloprotease [Actinosynnema mirum]ACU38585.1 peptidase M48 Ste24p [Actinosynnema mirum DSM 43827]
MTAERGSTAPLTTFRFALLVLVAVSVAGTLFLASFPGEGEATARLLGCLGVDPERYDEVPACADSALSGAWAWVTWWMAGFLLLALLLRAGDPRWRIRRQDLRAPEWDESAAPVVALTDLVDRIVPGRRPVVLLSGRANRTSGGQAFGTRRAPFLRLDSGLVAGYRRNPELFRSVVVHELAHVRSGDIGLNGAAVAIWRAFVVVLGLLLVVRYGVPELFGITRGADTGVGTAALWAVKAALLVLLVRLARNSVLRAREHEADLFTAEWTGEATYLVSGDVVDPRWRWGSHPTARHRLAVLADHRRLAPPTFGSGLVVGLSAQLAWRQYSLLISGATGFRSVGFVLQVALWGVVLGAFVIATAALASAAHVPWWRFAVTSAGLAVGLVLGGQAVFDAGVRWPSAGAVVLFALFGVLVTAVLWWAARCLSLVRGRSGRVVVSCVVLATCLLTAPVGNAEAIAGTVARVVRENSARWDEWLSGEGASPVTHLVADLLLNPASQLISGFLPALLVLLTACLLPLPRSRVPLVGGIVLVVSWVLLVVARIGWGTPSPLPWVAVIWRLAAAVVLLVVVAAVCAVRSRSFRVGVGSAAVGAVACGVALWSFGVVAQCVPGLRGAGAVCLGDLSAWPEITTSGLAFCSALPLVAVVSALANAQVRGS